MTQENNDKKFKQLFQDLRREDASQTPAFARVWQSVLARQEQHRQAMPGLRLAVACAVLMIIIGSALLFYQNRQRIAEDTGSLVTWRSPTASLLHLPPANPMTGSARNPAQDVPRKYTLTGWQSPTRALRKTPHKRSFYKIQRPGKYL